MITIILKSKSGENKNPWGIQVCREHIKTYFFGLFKKKILVWSLWNKYPTRSKMLESLESLQIGKKKFRAVHIQYKS